MRIVLYNPKSNAVGKRIMPFSLLAIRAVLEGEFEYEILDGNGVADADALFLPARAESSTIMTLIEDTRGLLVVRTAPGARP